jgi:dihydrofolate reductase
MRNVILLEHISLDGYMASADGGLEWARTLSTAPWGDAASATVVREDASEAVRRLKQEHGGDMLVLGSASVAHALIRDGLVDRPAAGGQPWLPVWCDRIALHGVRARLQ